MPNDRSDAALRERLVIAEKATQGPWKSDEVVTRKKDFEPSYVVKDKDGFTIVDVIPVSAYQANAAHIAASSPDVVREDIEEILRLRQEVARLDKESEWLVKVLSLFTEECPYRFYLNYEERIPIPPVDGCEWQWPECHECDIAQKYPGKCWRETARKAVEEEERHG